MVDKETLIKAVLQASNPLNNQRYGEDHIRIIVSYCKEKGKPQLQVELFIQYLAVIGKFKECFDIAADYYIRKFNLILVYDKDNKLINLIDRYVRTKRQTDCCNQEAVQELSSCNQED